MSQKCMCGGRGKGDKGVSAFFLIFFFTLQGKLQYYVNLCYQKLDLQCQSMQM